MSAIDELLPCAFCGARLERKDIFSSRAQTTYVHPESSPTCFAEGTLISTRDPERIAAWNRRALAPQQAAPMPGVPEGIAELVERHQAYDDNAGVSTRMGDLRAVVAALATPEAGTSEPVARHHYSPDHQAMGDCRACGNSADSPLHLPPYGPAPAQAPVDGEAVRAGLNAANSKWHSMMGGRCYIPDFNIAVEAGIRAALAAAPSARKEP